MAYLSLELDPNTGDFIKAHVPGGIGWEAINSAVQTAAADGVVAKMVPVDDNGPCLVYTADWLLQRAVRSGGILSGSDVAVGLATLAKESGPDRCHDVLRGTFAGWVREYIKRGAVSTASVVEGGEASRVTLGAEFAVWGYEIDEYLTRLETRKEEYFPLATWSVIAHKLGCCITIWQWSRAKPVVEKIVFTPLDLVVPDDPDSGRLSTANAQAEYQRFARLKYSSDLDASLHVAYIGEHFCPIDVATFKLLDGPLGRFPETGYVHTHTHAHTPQGFLPLRPN